MSVSRIYDSININKEAVLRRMDLIRTRYGLRIISENAPSRSLVRKKIQLIKHSPDEGRKDVSFLLGVIDQLWVGYQNRLNESQELRRQLEHYEAQRQDALRKKLLGVGDADAKP